ncbi:MAG: hypothetical protein K2N63_00075 [Lachnospiraceae bacterium]|nr:hypothetical protein [Lachnospiraceae bacterium]
MLNYDGMLLGARVMIGGGNGVMINAGSMMDDGGIMDNVGSETGVKDPILSNVPFVASTISVALVAGIVLGALLGKKRIKKGFDLYEN